MLVSPVGNLGDKLGCSRCVAALWRAISSALFASGAQALTTAQAGLLQPHDQALASPSSAASSYEEPGLGVSSRAFGSFSRLLRQAIRPCRRAAWASFRRSSCSNCRVTPSAPAHGSSASWINGIWPRPGRAACRQAPSCWRPGATSGASSGTITGTAVAGLEPPVSILRRVRRRSRPYLVVAARARRINGLLCRAISRIIMPRGAKLRHGRVHGAEHNPDAFRDRSASRLIGWFGDQVLAWTLAVYPAAACLASSGRRLSPIRWGTDCVNPIGSGPAGSIDPRPRSMGAAFRPACGEGDRRAACSRHSRGRCDRAIGCRAAHSDLALGGFLRRGSRPRSRRGLARRSDSARTVPTLPRKRGSVGEKTQDPEQVAPMRPISYRNRSRRRIPGFGV